MNKVKGEPLYSSETIQQKIEKEIEERKDKIKEGCNNDCDHPVCNQQYGAIQELINLREVFDSE